MDDAQMVFGRTLEEASAYRMFALATRVGKGSVVRVARERLDRLQLRSPSSVQVAQFIEGASDKREGIVAAATMRAKPETFENKELVRLTGYASVSETPYEMFDTFGPYMEVVSRGAFEHTLAASPDVAFLTNHKGVTMARTTNGTLKLSADDTGLLSDALVNPKRQDVADLVVAIDDGDIDQMSFAFRIDDGKWSPDFTEYRIDAVDLNRGDVSAVNYGANPHTMIGGGVRSAGQLEALLSAPFGFRAAAVSALEASPDMQRVPSSPTGRSVAMVAALLSLEDG